MKTFMNKTTKKAILCAQCGNLTAGPNYCQKCGHKLTGIEKATPVVPSIVYYGVLQRGDEEDTYSTSSSKEISFAKAEEEFNSLLEKGYIRTSVDGYDTLYLPSTKVQRKGLYNNTWSEYRMVLFDWHQR